MIEIDPKTRHMTREELSQVLCQLDTPGGEGDPCEERTRLWHRTPDVERQAQQRSVGIAEPVTELALLQVPAAKSSLSSVDAPIRKVARPSVSVRGTGARVASLLLVLAAAAGFAVHARGGRLESTPQTTPGDRAIAPAVAPVAETEAPLERDLPSGVAGPSERAAVDQLISGHLREALDSYRALALAHGDQPAFAFVAAQLERELLSCEPGEAPCAR